MNQMIGEFIEQDATFFTSTNTEYCYCYVDVDNDNEEILLATYNSMTGDFAWEEDDHGEVHYICNNLYCEYVKRVVVSAYCVLLLIYDVSKDEVVA